MSQTNCRSGVLARLRTFLVIHPLIVLSTVFFGSGSILISLFESTGNPTLRLARIWARTLLWFTNVRVEVEGLEKIDPQGRYVFCCNHLSYMDTPAVLANIPVQFRFLAKEELFKIPFMGTHLRQAGHVPVPLDDPRAALKVMTHAAQLLQSRAISLLIFPEGGRSEDGNLQPFKEGAAYVAIKAQAPLVPIALIGTHEVLPMHEKIFCSGKVRLRIADPIPTVGKVLKDRDTLTAAVREKVVELLEG